MRYLLQPLNLLFECSNSSFKLVCFCSLFFASPGPDMGKYNSRTGKLFLEKKAAEPGVTVLPSGLAYKVLTEGKGGAHPTKSDTVKVHYAGTLTNGKEFDSSYSRGQPAQFGVSGVIAGWTEALQLMSVGDVWELYIPGDLAYGSRGSGKLIGPNAVLVFKVELLEIVGKGGKDL